MAQRINPIPFLLAVFSGLLAFCALAAGGPEEILSVAPAVLLALALSFNRYPGERLIERVARHFQAARPRPTPLLPSRWESPAAIGKRLLLLTGARPLRGPPLLSSL